MTVNNLQIPDEPTTEPKTTKKTGRKKKDRLSIIPLGGVGEIGKNCWVYEYNEDLLIVDCGLMFPDDDMLGVDLVIPDTRFLAENRERLVGLVLTHGHEDHVGALAYFLKALGEDFPPIWGTRLTLGIAGGKLEEHGFDLGSLPLNIVTPGTSFELGAFRIDPIHVNHSIPDSLALGLHTPLGVIVHTGDFKFDQTPIDGKLTDFGRLAELGGAGVLALVSDCTNVEKPGYSPSERTVRPILDRVFREAGGRIIIATFASNVSRVQQVVNVAHANGRKVAPTGRSMVSTIRIASELGYLTIPEGTLIDLAEIDDLPPEEVAILTTGSQGEPLAALSLIARQDHKWVKVQEGDTVIISATPIPGNEALVHRTINQLFRQGAQVIYDPVQHVHATGHAYQEELRLMLNLVRPKYVVPAHGEDRQIAHYCRLAQEAGVPRERLNLLHLGEVLRISDTEAKVVDKVPHGSIMVDGLGVGDVGTAVLRDRKHLAEDGVMIVVLTLDKETAEVVAGPDIISRGFVHYPNAESLLERAKEDVCRTMDRLTVAGFTDRSSVKQGVKDSLSRFVYSEIKRRPMILPIVMEV